MLALLNTPLIRFSLNRICGQHKTSGYVNLLPICAFDDEHAVRTLVDKALSCIAYARSLDETQADCHRLCFPDTATTFAHTVSDAIGTVREAVITCEAHCHAETIRLYGVTEEEEHVLAEFRQSQPTIESPILGIDSFESALRYSAESVVSHGVGLVFGRWDVRNERDSDFSFRPFAPLPVYPSAMLINSDGVPATKAPEDYPFDIDWDGVLADDANHQDDIVRRLRQVLEEIWKGKADTIEKEVCRLLGISTLRDYIRKTGKGGFWDDHLKRYSKGRRKAPIYWLLQSSKKNYALWLYYHRLDKDMLFKALLNYVEPKIQRAENHLGELRSQKSSVGDSGKEAKKLDREIEKQEDLLCELRDFAEKLRKVADMHLVPDLNDGVVLNIAPLHELVPWKEAKKYWDELLAGKYDWSSIGKQLREKGLVK
jgi:hypothetical protein